MKRIYVINQLDLAKANNRCTKDQSVPDVEVNCSVPVKKQYAHPRKQKNHMMVTNTVLKQEAINVYLRLAMESHARIRLLASTIVIHAIQTASIATPIASVLSVRQDQKHRE